MNEEQISALMDDELAAPASAAAIDRLLADDALKATWRRYHVIGEVMRAATTAPAREAAGAVAPTNVVALPGRRRLPLLGVAMAASVAAIAVTLLALNPARNADEPTNRSEERRVGKECRL